MRHMSEPGDHNQPVKRIKTPRNGSEKRLGPEREESHRTNGDDIAERQYHRRKKNRHEQPGFEKFFPWQIRAHQQKSQKTPQRYGDHGHTEGHQKRRAERGMKAGIG